MRLWIQWFRGVAELRPACRRLRTFLWMVLVLAGLSTRPERAGITSFVRVLDLRERAYRRLLHLFHSSALSLDRLTELWTHLVIELFTPVVVGDYRVCLADGLKVGKEGKKMPAVRKLHQSGGSNSKAPYIMGHSFQAVSLLVRSASGAVAAIPLCARIHEGLIFSNRDRRSLLDKMVTLFLPLTQRWKQPVLLIADAYYASRKVILPLLDHGHQLITRARINTVAYHPAGRPSRRRRGRPKLYGKKVRLRDLAEDTSQFKTAPSPLDGDAHIRLQYRCMDLLWRPIGKLVRFVIVRHPKRGVIILMATDTELDPLHVLLLYSYRFKIEVGFKQAIHVLGSYAYHFWMLEMRPIRVRSGNQHLHMKTDLYRQQVRRKMRAYHLHVQLGCIAQGLLQHLALNHGAMVWHQFRSWLRTMDPAKPPSELVTAHALRDKLPEFLDELACDSKTKKFLRSLRRPRNRARTKRAA
jgi:hypothetical protein